MITFKELEKTYAGKTTVHALRKVNLSIPAGEVFGVIGPSGAGKSTLLRCINMLERPDSGEVWVNGVLMNNLNAKDLREARKKTGMIFQHFNLLHSRTVFENIAFPLELTRSPKDSVKEKVTKLAELVGLTDKLQSYPGQLSGGQKQRVGIARALASEPQLLLCDEATSALDPETTIAVLRLLKTINERLKLTIVLITHEMQVIQSICDSVAVLEDGMLQEVGPVVDVFTRPRSQASQRMLRGFLDYPKDQLRQLVDSNHTLLQLTFIDNKAHQPIISQLVRTYQVDVNILYGRLDQMKNTPFGMLLVELKGNQEQVQQATWFLRENQVEVEVIDP
ncbi:MAG TPA: ATP-binding cassette domain-containing protein [Limnochordia bacterium]|nr:ATP-binding cassette domain-containing protein [Limnochordia bacterium]